MSKEFYDKYGKLVDCFSCNCIDPCSKSDSPLCSEGYVFFAKDKITDLEAKLAQAKMNESFEKEKKDNAFKFIEELKQQLAEKDQIIENLQTTYQSVMQTCGNDAAEIKKLKKQTYDYADSLTKVLNENADLVFKLAEKENELEEVKQHRTQILNFGKRTKKVVIANPYGEDCVVYNQEDQDKISFALEQLEKVKETTECVLDNALKNSSLNQSYYDRLLDEIDNQIKQLKEKK